MDMVYTYDGEPLEIPFSITGASSGKTTEIGVLLFVDGMAQPYSAVYEDGTELEESYMQVFNLDYGQQENFNMVFQPVTGKAGETVPGFIRGWVAGLRRAAPSQQTYKCQ